MFKLSKYNFWASLGENSHLLFNGISGALYEFDEKEKETVLSLLNAPAQQMLEPFEQNLFNALLEGRFIIPSKHDELIFLLSRGVTECKHHEILDLVISPTYNCNFRCNYCYVEFKSGHMTYDIEQRVEKYLNKMFAKYKQVNITWFGGEPLLCLDTVTRVSQKISNDALEKNVQLRNFLTTNGYLLTLDTATKLFNSGIRYFHVTIDGPSECHDRLRVLANNSDTYKKIMDNINVVLANIPEVHLTLRMNSDETNVDLLYKVLDDIPFEFHKRIQINVFPILYSGQQPSKILYAKINRVIRYALEKEYLYYDIHIPIKRKTFCSADKLNNFQIGYDGTLYKCSPSTKKPEVKVGILNNQGEAEFEANYLTWQEAPSIGKNCAECTYLCFCSGGCRLQRLRGAKEVSCQDKYQDLENLIINRYIAINRNLFKGSI